MYAINEHVSKLLFLLFHISNIGSVVSVRCAYVDPGKRIAPLHALSVDTVSGPDSGI